MTRRELFHSIAGVAAASPLLLPDAPQERSRTPMSSNTPHDTDPNTTSPPALHYYSPLSPPKDIIDSDTDLCVYGSSPAGIAAAIQARRRGHSVVLLSFDTHIGGLTSGGLGATDIGNKAAIGGISREFYQRLGKHYGTDEQWTFEPHVAEEILRAMCREARVPVYYNQRLAGVEKQGNRITSLSTEGGHQFRARYFVDATYEGDLLARADVSFTVGRESNQQYGETYNGVHFGHRNHNFTVPVDPFVVPGNPQSGLLPGISPDRPGEQGEGDKHVQAYNFRLCMTKAADRLPFPKPPGYDPARYELFARYLNAGVWDALKLTVMMPNGKTDTNNRGGFSSDNIGMSDVWPEGSYEKRERIFQDHVNYHQGMMWFLCHDSRVPPAVREETKQWGLPRDEFTATGGWPHQLYIREARRMVSDYVMTEKNCKWEENVPDSIGLAAYGMDSHNCQRIARQEKGVWTARNEGNVEYPVKGPFPIAYRSLVPKETECANLVVPVCLSSSHIAYGSIRMEPVFFVLGQSAATAACLALEAGGNAVQKVEVASLQKKLLQDKQILHWTPPATEVTEGR